MSDLNLDLPSSPEQLDRCVRITSPLNWVAVGLVAIILMAVLAWSILSKLPSRSHGLGFVIQSDLQKFEITSEQSGVVEQVHVTKGQQVKKGDLLFTLSGRDVEIQLENAQKNADLLKSELDRVTRNTQRNNKQHRSVITEKNATLKRRIETHEKHRDFLIKHLKDLDAEFKKGYTTKSKVEKTRIELNTEKDSISNYTDEMATNNADLEAYEDLQNDSIHELEPGVQAAKAKIKELTQHLSAKEEIRSPSDGMILEISTKSGTRIQANDNVALLELPGGKLIVRGYLPLKDAQQVKPGMPTQVALSSIAPEIYGTIRGKVTRLSLSPVSRSTLMNLYENADIVDLIMDQGPPYAVDVELAEDPETVSGFEWSTSTGPPIKISSGSLASISIIYESHRPISYVFPIIGKVLD